MRNQNTNTNYSFADIEKYLQGKLSPAEMHELEKAALQDPFLADAIEGYQSTDLSFVQDDLDDIHNQLLQGKQPIVKTINAAGKLNFVWRAAAACILITGAAVLSWYLLNNKPTPQETALLTEMNNQSKKDSLSLTAAAMAKKESTGLLTKRSSSEPVPDQKIQLKKITAKTGETSIDKSDQKEPVLASRSAISSMQKIDTTITSENKTATAALTNQSFAGRVAGLEVNAAKKTSASKDQARIYGMTIFGDGNTKIQADTVLLSDFTYEAANRNTLVLAKKQPENPLNETIIVGQGKQSARANTLTKSDALLIPVNSSMVKNVSSAAQPVWVNNVIMIQNIEGKLFPLKLMGDQVMPALVPQAGTGIMLDTLTPDIGWDAYKDYLRSKLSGTSLNKGQDTILLTQFGTVELDIAFDNKGKVLDVTVLNSYNPLLNDKLVKAVVNGSAWSISFRDAKTNRFFMPQNKNFFRMSITFEL